MKNSNRQEELNEQDALFASGNVLIKSTLNPSITDSSVVQRFYFANSMMVSEQPKNSSDFNLPVLFTFGSLFTESHIEDSQATIPAPASSCDEQS